MGEFAKRAAPVLAEWERRLAAQKEKLHKRIPSAEMETAEKAMVMLARLRELAEQAGYKSRLAARAPRESLIGGELPGVPGREISISLPEVKQGWFDPRFRSKEAAFGAVTDPLRESMEDVALKAKHMAREKKRRWRQVTGEPGTLPWFYPALATQLPKSFLSGFRRAEQEADAAALAEAESEYQKAKKEFETSLSQEYTEARKTASAGEIIDGLADRHVKSAQGELNQVLGLYLALASVLGQGSQEIAREWTKKHHPAYRKMEALRAALKQRMMTTPSPILVEVPETAPAETEPGLG